MRALEQAVVNQDRSIKASMDKIKKALREAVELDGLSGKMMQKYLKFLKHKVDTEIEAENKSIPPQRRPLPSEITNSAPDFDLSLKPLAQ